MKRLVGIYFSIEASDELLWNNGDYYECAYMADDSLDDCETYSNDKTTEEVIEDIINDGYVVPFSILLIIENYDDPQKTKFRYFWFKGDMSYKEYFEGRGKNDDVWKFDIETGYILIG